MKKELEFFFFQALFYFVQGQILMMVKIRKEPDQKLFAAQGPGGTGGATGVSFTKIAHTD